MSKLEVINTSGGRSKIPLGFVRELRQRQLSPRRKTRVLTPPLGLLGLVGLLERTFESGSQLRQRRGEKVSLRRLMFEDPAGPLISCISAIFNIRESTVIDVVLPNPS